MIIKNYSDDLSTFDFRYSSSICLAPLRSQNLFSELCGIGKKTRLNEWNLIKNMNLCDQYDSKVQPEGVRFSMRRDISLIDEVYSLDRYRCRLFLFNVDVISHDLIEISFS